MTCDMWQMTLDKWHGEAGSAFKPGTFFCHLLHHNFIIVNVKCCLLYWLFSVLTNVFLFVFTSIKICLEHLMETAKEKAVCLLARSIFHLSTWWRKKKKVLMIWLYSVYLVCLVDSIYKWKKKTKRMKEMVRGGSHSLKISAP